MPLSKSCAPPPAPWCRCPSGGPPGERHALPSVPGQVSIRATGAASAPPGAGEV